jgi:hypothetical protein
MKKIVIFGNTVQSAMVFYDALGRSDFEIACFTVDKEYMQGSEFFGLPLVEFEKISDINGITIEEEALVGAGSVVIKNTEPFSKNVGNPSHIIGYHKEEDIKLVVNHR